MRSEMSTAMDLNELTTLPTEEDDIKRKNDKVFGVRRTRIQGKKDSSLSSLWKDANEYLSCGFESFSEAFTPPSFDYLAAWTSESFEDFVKDISTHYRDIIASYIAENRVHMLDINKLYVREYAPSRSIDVLHSLVNIAEEVFGDARPRTENESRRIDGLVRSKTKTIFYRPL